MSTHKDKSHDMVGHNIEKIVHDWERDGAIGSSHPKTRKKAVKQAVAISLQKAGKSKYQKAG